ncbi:hypothetical protein pdam_00004020 [Pocillopora damicornis]|uniref:5'-nucleotidase n=2 Tax=Pocillopora damicornis TaxID=46731 RepID=A0A3M6TDS8_POCDA|nr:hypothetical protein pdam_00004020 [Pocillopora damicornis]
MAVLLFKAFTAVLLISFGFSMVHGYLLTVLHTNDHHGRFEETDTSGGLCFPRLAKAGECFGGVARRATMIKKIRAEEKNVLLLSGGDVFTGTLWYLAYRGNASRKFMNELGYDAMALGNHEFDDGVDNLVAFLKAVNFSVVVSNLNVSLEPSWPKSPPLFVRSKVFDVGGEKIGIVGYVLQKTPKVSKPGPGPNVKFLPEVESLKSAVQELKKQNINKIIAVGHSGIDMDKKIAKEVDGVDIVVGGHTNTFLYTGTPPSTQKPYGPYPLVITPDSDPDGKVLVVQDYKYGKCLGRLNVEFDGDGKLTSWNGNPIILDNSVAKDPTIEREVQEMKAKVTELVDFKVGTSFVFLNAEKPDCLLKECNLGNLFTDAFVFHNANLTASETQWTEASIAIQNSGSITASMFVSAQEAVTYGYVVNSFPYRNTVDIVELTGEDLTLVFEQVATLYDKNDPSNSFLQVSGLRVKYDMRKPEGSRVVEIQVRCASCRFPSYQPVVLSTVYKVILSSYIVRGGAGLTAIDEKKLSHQVGNNTVDRVIANYFKAKSPIMTGVEGRITFMNDNDDKLCVNGVNTFGLRFPLLIGAITSSVFRAIFN